MDNARCQNCFKPYQRQRVTSRFCSDACRVKYHRKQKAMVTADKYEMLIGIIKIKLEDRERTILNRNERLLGEPMHSVTAQVIEELNARDREVIEQFKHLLEFTGELAPDENEAETV